MKDVVVKWIDSVKLLMIMLKVTYQMLMILVPGGFGFRASEGKISAIKYALRTMFHSLVSV